MAKDHADVPEIDCYSNQFNQVYMKILVNDPHAIQGEGELEKKTFTSGDQVVVNILDTGFGIPKENSNKIINPGFTSKSFGVGRVAGLSIVH